MKADPVCINDIRQCVEHARTLTGLRQESQRTDRRLYRVFTCLAGDEVTGLLAYAIWRGRSKLLSRLRRGPAVAYDGATGARHAQA